MRLSKGKSPPKAMLSVRGTSPPKQNLGVDEEGARKPPVRKREISLSSTGLKRLKPLRSYPVAGSGERARKFSDTVGAAFAVLECAVERGDELKLSMDSCVEGPDFANALLCLVAAEYAELCCPK